MSRFARKVDANHAEVVAALRAVGAWVHDTSRLGGGFPDLFVSHRGRLFLLEVKDGRKPPSARKLSPAEREFVDGCPLRVHIVLCAEDAVRLVLGREEAA